ncbi:hypothetical protein GJV52_11500 [Neisseria brasiliensis]|uniref:tail fiber protein n=2 Tax=Neisseria TaxID=482 RepID=UPI0012A98346|nr:tail fiber protein [Neisseria brasiliensis]QGL26100.1 hypothetical protein GJV52_11500 [Neisseria brasiliensis]
MKEINTPDKRFVDGNGRDVLGTVVTADWLNAVQGEIVGLITGLNAKVNGAVPNQMYRAIANALAEKANANTTITAGNGLTGGGNLSANRTIALGTPSTITATSGNTVAASSHSHAIDKASTTAAGIVQLNNTLTSSATNQALTAAMGKKLQDEKLGNSGSQTLDGILIFNDYERWERWRATTKSGYWRFDISPEGETTDNGIRFNYVFIGADGKEKGRIAYKQPNGIEHVAYRRWVEEQINGANPTNRNGINLDSQTTPCFFTNPAASAPLPVGGDVAGMVIGYRNDSTQIIASDGNMWVRGSDKNPISKPSDWGKWSTILTDGQLSDVVNSSSSSTAASSRAVKTAYDKAVKAATATRRSYSRTINGTASGHTEQTMRVTGETVISPDGSVVQYFHIKNARVFWFDFEEAAVGYGNTTAGRLIDIDLWTAMPNKVCYASIQFVRATDTNISQRWQHEASEHKYSWNPRGTNKNKVSFNSRRWAGDSDELIDMVIKVEGY